MRWHFRMVATLAMALLGYAVLLAAFHLLNQPSDRALLGGISLILALLIFIPLLARMIWRRL